jgi:hypothetical protein
MPDRDNNKPNVNNNENLKLISFEIYIFWKIFLFKKFKKC